MFYGDNFILGLIGLDKQEDLIKDLEKLCTEMSSKPVKTAKKDEVKFDFKIKG